MVLLALAALLAACARDEPAAGRRLHPVTPGALTVATAFVPAPGFWEGSPPVKGFEAALAAALARELGLGRVVVKQVPFAELAAGRLHGADLALSQLSPTDERERSLDFSAPYLAAPAGVLARRGVDAADVQDLRNLRWVTARVSTLTPIVNDTIRPRAAPIVVGDRAEAIDALRAGRAQALLLDLPVALGLARDDPASFHVIGQLPDTEQLAAALPEDSTARETIDSAIHRLQADGTIDRLESRWLGVPERDVPLIRTED